MSGDESLIDAYNSAQDIHRITASKVFKIPYEEVSEAMRRNAKAVNFGIVYGISSFGLSQDLSISRKEANEYIKQYFETYPGIKAFLDKTIEDAKKDGYVKTLFNRIRPIPELNSSNFMQRSFGERIAMNSPIQGTAADIMKIAMVAVDKKIKDMNLKSKIVLQVHDELLIEASKDEVDIVCDIVKESMMNAANLKVKLDINISKGLNWLEAH
jgi:DNA polymerase-1